MISVKKHFEGRMDDGQPVLMIGQKLTDVSPWDIPGGEVIPVNLGIEKSVLMVFYHYRREGNKAICLNICTDRFLVK
jgi:hypothetical protein